MLRHLAPKAIYMNIQKQIKELISAMSDGVWEKDQIIALCLLSSIAGESIFLLGPPGTGKSLVARRLKNIFKNNTAFEYLMSRFSTPDEIFGPVSIRKLKEEDAYERMTEGYLPSANIVFLDEIWKAGPAIQNALLTAINEKIFLNGSQTMRLPMKTLIAASNELPKEDEGLEALWDRFLIRLISNNIESETTFYKMLRQSTTTQVDINSSLLITDDNLRIWRNESHTVILSDSILKAITFIRNELKQLSKGENIEPLDYYISDRRWKKNTNLLQYSAFLNNRKEVDWSDMLLLFHTLWNKVECIDPIAKVVIKSLFFDLLKRIDTLGEKINTNKSDSSRDALPKGQATIFQVYSYFYAKLLPKESEDQDKNLFLFLGDYEYLPLNKTVNGIQYHDEKTGRQVVRRLDDTLLESPYNKDTFSTVKMRRGIESVIINEVEYMLEKSQRPNNFTSLNKAINKQLLPNIVNLHYEDMIYSIRTDFEQRKKLITDKNRNIFISESDVKLVKRYCAHIEKRVNAIEVKIISHQT